MGKKRFDDLHLQIKEKNFSGHVLCFASKHKVFEAYQGYAHYKKEVKINPQSVFGIASGTKFLTALVIGILIDQGKISLETYAKDILDLNNPNYHKDIQIKHLLSHTSGMPDYLDESDTTQPNIDNASLRSIKDYLNFFPSRPMDFHPGNQFKYHNGAYVYLAAMIEHITKSSYIDAIEKFILSPLGIQRSGMFTPDSSNLDIVLGYIDHTYETSHIGLIPHSSGGDGGAYMNAFDFKKIVDAFLNHQYFSQELKESFMKPHATVDEENNVYYGYGLWLKKVSDSFIPYVVGGDAGISFKCVFHPCDQSFYWCVSNTNHGAWDIISAFNKEAFTK